MDPRHPELAVARIKELIKQYDRIEEDIKRTAVSSKLGQLEREGSLVIQEICLVAPRIHEAMMQASRQRRHELSMGFFPEVKAENLKQPTPEAVKSYATSDSSDCVPEEKADEPAESTIDTEEQPDAASEEKAVTEEQPDVTSEEKAVVESKPEVVEEVKTKKKVTKKKTTKKTEKADK